jgi:DNA-binding MarR family transcriptional regulator
MRRIAEKLAAMTTDSQRPAMQRAPQPISPVESHLAYWLHYVGWRVFHELRLRARQCGVTAAEWVALRKLHEHAQGATASHLALRLGLSRGYLSRLAVRLEAKGLIYRDKSLSDRRLLNLRLTALGRALLPVLAELADQTNARHFAGAGRTARAIIEKVMKGIVYWRRFRFVPPDPCRIPKYQYLHLGIDWDEEQDGEGDG